METVLALVNSQFSCALATSGNIPLARQLADEADAVLWGVCQDPQADSKILHALLVAACNSAVLNESSGESTIAKLRSRMARCSQSGSSGLSNVSGPEVLVDAHQLLMRLLWNEGRWAEAEAACMASCTILKHRIHELQNTPESLDDRPTHRQVRALSIANRNLLALHNCRDNPSPNSSADSAQESKLLNPLANAWRWRQLFGIQGQSIDPTVLTQGKLHGEFEHQEGLMLAWADPQWGRKPVLEIIKAAYESTQIILLVRDAFFERDARKALIQVGVNPEKIHFSHVPTDTVWIRDFGPLAIDDLRDGHRFLDSEYRIIDRYLDDRAPREISRLIDRADENVAVELELEWGALVCNGQGLCLVSSNVLRLNQDRGIQESHITNTIKRLTGSQKLIYLNPLQGELTGHLDMLLTFTAPDTVVVGEYRSHDPSNAKLLDQHAQTLSAEVTPSGAPLKVVRMPMPPPKNSRFAGSYTNVVFANGKLLVPKWSNAAPALQTEAFEIYQRLLPDWKIEGIECHELGLRGGALHCTTMNLFRIQDGFNNPDS